MAAAPLKQAHTQGRQVFRLLAFMTIAAVATILAVVGAVYYSARLVDETSLEQETLQTTRRVDSALLTMRDDVRSAVVWNDAYSNLLAANTDWTHVNIGKYFADYMN